MYNFLALPLPIFPFFFFTFLRASQSTLKYFSFFFFFFFCCKNSHVFFRYQVFGITHFFSPSGSTRRLKTIQCQPKLGATAEKILSLQFLILILAVLSPAIVALSLP